MIYLKILKGFCRKAFDKLFIYLLISIILFIIFKNIFVFFILAFPFGRLLIRFVKFHTADLLPEKIIKINSPSSFLECWYLDLKDAFEDGKIDFNRYGFALFDYKGNIGKQVTPTNIAFVALYYLQKYLKSKQEKFLKYYKDQIGYMKNRYLDLGDRGLVWVFDFDWKEGKGVLKAPWFSALSQGLIISILIRDYFIFGNEDSLKIAKKATKIFEFGVPFGVRYILRIFYLNNNQ